MGDSVLTDLRYAIRSLRLSPGFSAAVVLTLALGIGANAAMFTIVNAVVLRPLPYPQSERIVSLSARAKGVDGEVVDDRTYEEWTRESQSFVALGVYSSASAVLESEVGPEDVRGQRVSASYFDVLGVRPRYGRTFTPDEDRLGAAPVVLLSEQMWRSNFGADPRMVGKSVALDGVPTMVIGIMPASFTTPLRAQYWKPYMRRPISAEATFFYEAIGRLRRGASIESVRAELTAISKRLDDQRPAKARGSTPVVVTLHDRKFGDSGKPLLLLLAAVAVLLLIACANLANLSLARAVRRQREFALRRALGAPQVRLVRYVLLESVLLSVSGAVLGVLLAAGSVGYFTRMGPSSVGHLDGVSVDTPVLLFTLAVALVTGVVFGLIPAISAGRGSLNQILSSGNARASGGKGQRVVRRMLVISELATALVLLTGAGLVARTFWRVLAIDPGFDPDRLVSAAIHLPYSRYNQGSAAATFFDELTARLRAVPLIQSFALVNATPLAGVSMSVSFQDKSRKQPVQFDVVAAGADYFKTLRLRIIDGRPIGVEDRAGAPRVVVVTSALAPMLVPTGRAVGTSFDFHGMPTTIIGIVDDVHQRGLEAVPKPLAFLSLAQEGAGPWMTLMFRTSGAPASAEGAITHLVQSIDRSQPPPAFQPMEQALADAAAPRRFVFALMGIFAALAASLAVSGLYGVLSYIVAEQTREIGIRAALGADRARLTRHVLGQGIAIIAIGTAVGVAGSAVAVRAIRTLLYEVDPYDPATFIAVAGLLAGVSLVACYVPARRASRVDPMVALRAE